MKLRVPTLGIRWLACIFLAFSVSCVSPDRGNADQHWVATWGTAPQLTEPRNLPPVPLANSTLRQFLRVSIGGKEVRVKFSNAYGANPVTLHAAHVALAVDGASGANGGIQPATGRSLTFGGAPGVVIPAGESAESDPFAFDLPALADVAVSIAFGDISATSVCGHPGSRTTSFIQAGNTVNAPDMTGASKTQHWYILSGVDVLDAQSSRAIVVLGDSITDGRGSTTDRNDRWPDALARRLNANPATTRVGVVNMGIGGNAIFGGLGPAAVARFDRDVLDQSGVRWVIVFEGVNDIGGANARNSAALTTNLISAYTGFIEKAHSRNLLAYGATITPFGGHSYFTPARETARQAVNAWIRTNTLYDAVIDFDAIVRHPVTLTNLLSDYDSGDGLHLNPNGYRAMAEAIDLSLFRK